METINHLHNYKKILNNNLGGRSLSSGLLEIPSPIANNLSGEKDGISNSLSW